MFHMFSAKKGRKKMNCANKWKLCKSTHQKNLLVLENHMIATMLKPISVYISAFVLYQWFYNTYYGVKNITGMQLHFKNYVKEILLNLSGF